MFIKDIFNRSLTITKLTLELIKQDKELLLFPALTGVFGTLFFLALLFPTWLLSNIPFIGGVFQLMMLFTLYFGLSFITTFFGVCVVFTARTRFSGKNATFWDSINFAKSRLVQILKWSIVSGTVGMFLAWLERSSKRAEVIRGFLLRMISGTLSLGWSIATVFVFPVMVYENVGPFDAIKRSSITIKKTWGESVARYFGVGLLKGLFVGLGLIVFLIPLWLAFSINSTILVIIVLISAFIYFIFIVSFFNLVEGLFNTALYAYANKKPLLKGYDGEMLKQTFE